MPKVTSSINNLSGGELSPLAMGRYDITKWDSSAKLMENFLINQLGGAMFRSGTRYVASTKDNGIARLMAFQFDADQDYVMEFTDLNIRFYSNDATLLTISQFVTQQPPAHNDTYVKSTSKQSTDYWHYFATDPAKNLTGVSEDNSWRAAASTQQRFHIDLGSAKVVTRFYYENLRFPSGGGTTNYGAKTFTVWGSNNGAAFAELTYGTDTNWTQITASQATLDEHVDADVEDPKYIEITNTTAYRYYAFKFADNYGGAVIGLRRIALQTTLSSTDLTSTYLEADLFKIMQAHKNDVKYLTEENYPPRKITRISATDFAINDVDFVRGPFLDDNITATTINPSSATGSTTLTAVGADIFDDPDHVGSLWRVKDGVVKITAVNSPTEAEGTVQVEPDGTAGNLGGTVAITDWAEGAFSAFRGYPKAVAFHDGRLYYGGTTYEPQKIWGSVTFAYDNFDKGSAADSDAVTFEIATEERNAIQWLISGKSSLSIGTSGGTFSAGGSADVSITPGDIQITRDTNYGAALLAPKRISSFFYYVQRTLNTLREISFNFDIDAKIAADMNLLADHILRDGSGVIDLDHQQSPNDRIWCVRNDGQLAVLTRNSEQEVIGWCRIKAGVDSTTSGEFESVAVIPKQNAEDQVWVVTKRLIGGVTKRFIEFFTPENFKNDWDAVRVDSSVTMDVPIIVSGATKANPVVITATDHGLSNGDQVRLDNVVGMTELNKNTYLIANKNDDDFELQDISSVNIDGTGFTTYISGGETRLMTTAVSGLGHQEGEVVFVQADGIDLTETFTVASGAITLTTKAAVVHTGFKYNGTIQLLKLSDGSATGTGQTKDRRIYLATIRVDRSLRMKIGLSEAELDAVEFGDVNGEVITELVTKDIEKLPRMRWTKDAELLIRQDRPSPLNILAIVLKSEVVDG